MTNQRSSTSAMIYLDEAVATDPLRCDHASGEVSMRITSGGTTNWLVGTPAEWRAFAHHIANLADEITRGGEVDPIQIERDIVFNALDDDQFTDEDDFNESRASDEVWS